MISPSTTRKARVSSFMADSCDRQTDTHTHTWLTALMSAWLLGSWKFKHDGERQSAESVTSIFTWKHLKAASSQPQVLFDRWASWIKTCPEQVHGVDHSPLPPLWNSFFGPGIHNGPVPPAWFGSGWHSHRPLRGPGPPKGQETPRATNWKTFSKERKRTPKRKTYVCADHQEAEALTRGGWKGHDLEDSKRLWSTRNKKTEKRKTERKKNLGHQHERGKDRAAHVRHN